MHFKALLGIMDQAGTITGCYKAMANMAYVKGRQWSTQSGCESGATASKIGP